MKYHVLLHFQDKLVDLTPYRKRFGDNFSVRHVTQEDYDIMKRMSAPNVTDEEFWPRGSALIIEEKDPETA
jgi:hypothetical protein